MNISPNNIIPVTQARSKLGDLTENLNGENYIILTKGGNAKAALVDIRYLNKLQSEVKRIYQKTFIDPSSLPYSRQFSKTEIDQWVKEDAL